ncbi:hypothetical protein DB345_18475 [Spartobacteria bacterium LR76]|nr:hypothetical protein DB345_18475 [Spartobacteria bacterium LR76]
MEESPFAAPFIYAAGGDIEVRVEDHPDPERIDHVWISIDTEDFGRIQISVNTDSRNSLLAGFDRRVRVGTLRRTWAELPPRIVQPYRGFDYEEIPDIESVIFEPMTRVQVESLLKRACYRASMLEVWGTPYERPRIGIHQIHSRRASRAVPIDLRGRDGAMQFYFRDDHSTLLMLLKFDGQP